MKHNDTRIASEEEIEQTMIEEAQRRGFLTEGVRFKSVFDDCGMVRTIKPFICHGGVANPIELEIICNSISYRRGICTDDGGCSNPSVYKNGKWAEILPEEPKKKEPKEDDQIRVGDTVEVLHTDYPQDISVGEKCKVHWVGFVGAYLYCNNVDDGTRYFLFEEIRKVKTGRKELTLEEIAEKFNIPVSQLRIKD